MADAITPTLDQFLADAHRALLADHAAQTFLLRERCISLEAVHRLRLGWHQEHLVIPVADPAGIYTGYQLYEPDATQRDKQRNPKMRAAPGTKRDLVPGPETWPPDAQLHLVEGEPDALTLISCGLAACAYPGTAGWKPGYAARFDGRDVVIWPDDDTVGREAAERIAADLKGHTSSTRITHLMLEQGDTHYDLTDEVAHLVDDALRNGTTRERAFDGARETLTRYATQTPTWPVAPYSTATLEVAEHDAPPDDQEPSEGWLLRGYADLPTIPVEAPRILRLFYPGTINSLIGEPGAGKTLVALIAIIDTLNQGLNVLHIDHEMGPHATRLRLEQLGVDQEAISDPARYQYIYDPPAWPIDPARQLAILHRVERLEPGLVLIDAWSGSLASNGYSENSNDDVALWDAKLAKPIVAATGAALSILDHVRKDTKERGGWGIGAQRKRGLITGASYSCEMTVPFAIGVPGRLRIVTQKDRNAHRARGKRALDIAIDGTADHIAYTLEWADPTTADRHDAGFRPTFLMERISRHLEGRPAPTPRLDVYTDVTGKQAALRVALDVLIADGYVASTEDGRTTRVASIRPYREADEPAAKKPAPPTAADPYWNEPRDPEDLGI